MPSCNKCGREIGFKRSAKNKKWIPIDLPGFICRKGDDVGSVLTDDGQMVNTTWTKLESDTLVYNVHFGTCPERR